MRPKEYVLASLPGLDKNELEQVAARLGEMLGRSIATDAVAPAQDPEEQSSRGRVWSWVCESLRSAGYRKRLPPYPIMIKSGKNWSRPLAAVVDAVSDVESALNVGATDASTSVSKRLAEAYTLLELLARQELRMRSLPLTPKTLLETMGDGRLLIERAFPGYPPSAVARFVRGARRR